MNSKKKPIRIWSVYYPELTASMLKRSGQRQADLTAWFPHAEPTPKLVVLSPTKRKSALATIQRSRIEQLRARWPNLKPVGKRGDPRGVSICMPAWEVPHLASRPEVESVWISNIRGMRRRSSPIAVSKQEWYAVRARVAIQIEGQTSGVQTLEDRIVLVKASSFDDAIKRLRGEWRRYSRPYFNRNMEMVRWKLDKVVDVYSIGETEIDPAGTEVYSSLKHGRRMRAEFEWHPGQDARRRNIPR